MEACFRTQRQALLVNDIALSLDNIQYYVENVHIIIDVSAVGVAEWQTHGA